MARVDSAVDGRALILETLGAQKIPRRADHVKSYMPRPWPRYYDSQNLKETAHGPPGKGQSVAAHKHARLTDGCPRLAWLLVDDPRQWPSISSALSALGCMNSPFSRLGTLTIATARPVCPRETRRHRRLPLRECRITSALVGPFLACH